MAKRDDTSPHKTSASKAGASAPHAAEPHAAEAFARNMQKIAERSQELLEVYLQSQQAPSEASLQDSWHINAAFLRLFERMLANPTRLWEAQLAWWQDYLQLWQSTARAFAGEPSEPVVPVDPKDRRFKDKAWQENVVFDFLRQSYLLSASHLQHLVHDVDGLDEQTRKKTEFYTRQYIDALSPSNFLLTNPEVLRTTLESHGENLVRGLENVLEDLKRGNGQLRISMTDDDAFEIGRNLALTPGSVIYQNDLIQLIQYEAATTEVYKTPVLVIPAWINKYYILDLRPENSLVKWLTEQGHTVFIISWVNPDERLSRKTFDDYLTEGVLAAMDAIEQATGEKQISTIGYCLGGTLLACTLAYLHAHQQGERVRSATFLTTMTDFSDAGELSVFIDEEQLQALEHRMQKHGGVLEGRDMSLTFNLLRANDLIWSFVVNNYLLGKDPFPFDLLYWNGDSTRMPAAMHSFYLRKMYMENKLVEKGGITLLDTPLDLRSITTPAYLLSTREDHIAPWKSTYKATRLYSGEVRFVLAGSGHIAGVVNPPAKEKYGYWTIENGKKRLPENPDIFLEQASEHKGSWWPHWHQWQLTYAGEKIPARTIGGGALKPIEPAPGSYVKVDAR